MERASTTKNGAPPLYKNRYVGYCAELTDHVAKKLGFEYQIHPVKDGAYGSYVDANDTWNGMIGELIRGVSYLAIAIKLNGSARNF